MYCGSHAKTLQKIYGGSFTIFKICGACRRSMAKALMCSSFMVEAPYCSRFVASAKGFW